MENVKRFAAKIVDCVRRQQQVSKAAFAADKPVSGGSRKAAVRPRSRAGRAIPSKKD
jgi:hypothetical protein